MFHACDRVLTFEPNCATSRSTCEDADVTTAGPGRPRLRPRRRPGSTARAEILDAAAELFTSRGFAATSTRLIAEAVGIRQASLYNHFTTKNDILVALLEDTIEPALDFAEALDQTLPPTVQLCALVWFDAAQLCANRWNLGALYHLPEIGSDIFEPFRHDRRRLLLHYRHLATLVVGSADLRTDLPFRLVESSIVVRADFGTTHPGLPRNLAESALTVLGVDDVEGCVDAARVLVEGAGTPAIRPQVTVCSDSA